jgi:hypothetical protein
MAKEKSTKPTFKGDYFWVTVGEVPNEPAWIPVSLGEFPPISFERGRRVCLPVEYINVLKDSNENMRTHCVMIPGRKPKFIQQRYTKYPMTLEPATEQEWLLFREAQRALKMPETIKEQETIN